MTAVLDRLRPGGDGSGGGGEPPPIRSVRVRRWTVVAVVAGTRGVRGGVGGFARLDMEVKRQGWIWDRLAVAGGVDRGEGTLQHSPGHSSVPSCRIGQNALLIEPRKC